MDSLSFKGFHTELNCKLMYSNKNQTQLTPVQSLKFHFQKQNSTEQNNEKYNQTGITVKICTNHDGVRANAIMLRSIMSSSSW